MRKIKIIIILSILIIFPFPFIWADPSEDDDCYTCHSQGNYEISTTTNLTQIVYPNSNFSINIAAHGYQVEVWAYWQARDNRFFTIFPNMSIADNSKYDTNQTANSVSCIINISAPSQLGDYNLLILARSPYTEPTRIVYLEFTIFVTDDPDIISSSFNFKAWLKSDLLNHLNIYIGTLALLTLLVGTILMEINYKYNKIHARLAIGSFLLTTVNIVVSLDNTWLLITSWWKGNPIDWGHASHMIIGIVGYFVALWGGLQGLAGHKMKKWGYMTLLLWGFNFIFGILYWGVGI